jgi:F-type H+-transporting ATPase subunit epsilon
LGIAPLHAPMIGRLGFGELRILDGGKTERLYVDGGFVQVTGNTVYILTNRAIPAEKLDQRAAEEQLKTARTKPANTAELLAVRERQVSQARAQLRVAQRT